MGHRADVPLLEGLRMRRVGIPVGASSLLLAVMVAGCAAQDADQTGSAVAASAPTATGSTVSVTATASASSTATTEQPVEITPLPEHGVVDYQLGAAYDEVSIDGVATAIDVVVRDSTSVPLEGAYSICYVNGFQTQPEDASWDGRSDLLLTDDAGEPVVDPDWPDEHVLDPSTAQQREGILAIVGTMIEECAARGFDAVEIDNLDTWTRFEEIDRAGTLALAQEYADLAHSLGLAIAQKNAVEIAQIGAEEIGFDFAIAEECAIWDECADYLEAYQGLVLEIEYADALDDEGMTFAQVCGSSDRAELLILRDRDLVGPTSSEYVYDRC